MPFMGGRPPGSHYLAMRARKLLEVQIAQDCRTFFVPVVSNAGGSISLGAEAPQQFPYERVKTPGFRLPDRLFGRYAAGPGRKREKPLDRKIRVQTLFALGKRWYAAYPAFSRGLGAFCENNLGNVFVGTAKASTAR
jgi:hypothetical protein